MRNDLLKRQKKWNLITNLITLKKEVLFEDKAILSLSDDQ